MRKSFTRLSSLLVLLLLSIQMVMAVPKLTTPNGLDPADGGQVSPTTNPVFTMNFQANVQPGELLQIIGLYNSNGVETKAIQLKSGQKTTSADGVITFTHSDGVVVFNGKVVTIQFTGVNWSALQNDSLWITVGSTAIKDANGNYFDITTPFDGGKRLNRWDFKVNDVGAPTVKALYPKDNAPDVSTYYQIGSHSIPSFAIKFNEDVQFVDENPSLSGLQHTINLGNFALYTSTDAALPTPEEGGDLVSVRMPYLRFYLDNALVTYPAVFDSVIIEWDLRFDRLPNNSMMYVRVKPGIIEDLSGNDFAGINNNTDWNFTTKDDYFTAPLISRVGHTDPTPTPACDALWSSDKFEIHYGDGEILYFASNGLRIPDGTDLKQFVHITDYQGDAIAIKTAKLSNDTVITVIPDGVLKSSDISFKVAIDSNVFLDASGNKSKYAENTFAAGNWDAPSLVEGWPKVVNQSGTTMDFQIKTNEACAVHYIVVRKNPALDPTAAEIFGYKDLASPAVRYTTVSNNDWYYRINSTEANGTDTPLDKDLTLTPEGNYKKYYGDQTGDKAFSMVEIFAEGNINIPTANTMVQKRISNLPATHGIYDDPAANYEIWYVLVDTICTQGAFASAETKKWVRTDEHISAPLVMEGSTVFTVDILMPEVWFDGDSTYVDGATKSLNSKKKTPVELGLGFAEHYLAKNGKLYINFNEPIRKEDNTEFSTDADIQSTELKACLIVKEGSKPVGADRNSDANWGASYGYRASLANGNKQIVITPDSSWASSDTVWVKIKNSKIEDLRGNEIVPHSNLYTQAYHVEDYTPPLVRYSYGTIWEPLDSMTGVNYKIGGNPTLAVAPITVTVSGKIYPYAGCLLEDNYVIPAGKLIDFSNDTTKLAYIGNFFKIRAGNDTTVSESSNNALEISKFLFNYKYDGDSTVITITPKEQYQSEVWYFIQLDGRVQDQNLRTIDEGAGVDLDSERPEAFELDNSLTGNATLSGWIAGDPTTDDNKTCVFKSEDSRNPLLKFYTKKQSTLLSNLVNIDGRSDIVKADTIGVYIDEYVSLGFDHYVHFDALSGHYTLDANAMRQYFKVFGPDSSAMDFDVVGLDITALLNDSLIFYIDPYYVNTDGTAKSGTEGENFNDGKCYWVWFNSQPDEDFGVNSQFGKTKGIYWDDNHNMVLDKWAHFCVPPTPAPDCVKATITPAPSAECLTASSINYISVGLPFAAVTPLPFITISEGSSSVFTVTGQLTPGNSNIVRFNITDSINGGDGFLSDSTYTVRIGTGFANAGGHIEINSGVDANQWPLEDCIEHTVNDSTWTYKMVDETAPLLDSLRNAIVYFGSNSTQSMRYIYPMDDTCSFDKTKNIIMVFNEDVKLGTNKAFNIYDSEENLKARIYSQQCSYGKTSDYKKDNYKVIVVPSSAFASSLAYETDYHINIDAGFVTDRSTCHYNNWAGIWVQDDVADCAYPSTDGLSNDWSFRTGSDPAPTFTLFSPANGTPAVSNLTVTFSEPVNANSTTSTISVYYIENGTTATSIATFASNATGYITPSANKTVWTLNASAIGLVKGNQYYVTIAQNAFTDSHGSPLAVACTGSAALYSTILGIDQTVESAATWWIRFSDDVAPFVQNNWPRQDAMHVPYNAYLYIEFNEPVEINDGSAIIPQPLLNQTIDRFLVVRDETLGRDLNYALGEFDVEFVGSLKKLIRITPMDTLGYAYDYNNLPNPTMQSCHEYSVTLSPTAGSYSIVDKSGNLLTNAVHASAFSFTTEDVKAPVIGTPTVAHVADGKCSNKFNVHVPLTSVTETPCQDTIRVYWAVLPKSASQPSPESILGQSVANATLSGVAGGKLATSGADFQIDLGDWDENPLFKLYAVATDNEIDIWETPSADWDSLFMFSPDNGEEYTRITDIRLAPNTNKLVVKSADFMIWDDNLPELAGSYPHSGDIEIPINANVKFWFNEAVEAGTAVPDSITLRRWDNNIAVAAVVTFADSSFTINPTAVLDQETKYYVEFDRYAIQDTANVCPDDRIYYPQMLKPEFWFVTEDNIGPRFAKADPKTDATCVSCPGLNENGLDTITLTFYETNDVVVASGASDPYVYLYRTVDPTSAWLVVPAGSIKIANAKGANYIAGVDTVWNVKVPVKHQYYPNDEIKVVVPAGLITDEFSNKYTNTISGYTTGAVNTVVWYFTTCNTAAPRVDWSVHNLSAYFNYSEAAPYPAPIEPGIYAKWDEGFRNGIQGEDDPTGIPTNIALKITFGEEVAFNTATDVWEPLSSFDPIEGNNDKDNLVPSELMTYLKIGGLQYSKTKSASDIDTVIVDGNSVTLLFKYGSYAKLPSTKILAEAQAQGHITNDGTSSYLANYYKASLESNKAYPVTVTANKVRATENCVKLSAPRYVLPNIVTLNTRDDSTPTVDFTNVDGKSLCDSAVCIGKNEPIVISFSDSIVKTSVDVNWLGEESYTFDNLPLREADLEYPVKRTSPYHYFELIKIQNASNGSWTRTRLDTMIITSATLDPALMNYTVSTQDLESEQWYELVFKKYTVKKYIDSDPSGAIYEGGDTCRFRVGDYINPDYLTLSPDSGETDVDSDTKEIKLSFDENVVLGTDQSLITRIRRQDGSIFKEFTPAQAKLVNAYKADKCDTVVFTVNALENFTTYYIEMPEGFVTDDNAICDPNPFAGFAARLGSDGMMMSADWWFTTSDSTAPELIAVVGDETQRNAEALYPKVGSTVSTTSDLVMVFDENVEIDCSNYRGIVIYHDNGASGSFGNAVEFIPWSEFCNPFGDSKISVSGSNVYDGLTSNVITINPETVFDKKGVYYVRVNGDDIEDGSGNEWQESVYPQRDEITDREWYFSIVNDAAPILVSTSPDYDGVLTPRTYVSIPETTEPTLGFVKADLSMVFEDADGDPIEVARGSNTRMVKIFEYTYDAATAQFKSKPWITLPITDPSIEFVGNVVTIKDVILRDGIDGRGTALANDSVYYVTVDNGAVLNGLSESSEWWEGINNPFVWRFQTKSDDTFVSNADILSPNFVDNGNDAKNLTIEEADSLIVTFGEGIEVKAGATGKVQIYEKDNAATTTVNYTVTSNMIKGNKLTVGLTGLKDLTSYVVEIQANAFGDTSTVSTPNTFFGGVDVWEFHTGDNTAPQSPIATPAAGCVESTATLSMTFNEPFGVTNVGGAGTLEVKDADGKVWASVDVADVVIGENKNIVTALVEGLPDTTDLTVTVPAGFLFDLDEDSPLANLPISWTFTTGENTAPSVVEITPAEVVTPDTLLAITFSEIVGAVGGKTITINGVAVDVDSLESSDGIVYTYPLEGLESETMYTVVIEEGAFIDVNNNCVPNILAATTDSFSVGDIIAPAATGSPKEAADYKDLVLSIAFTDAVTPATGNVVIYDAETDLAIETIAVDSSAFTASDDKTVYTFAPSKVRFGEYYILIDAGAFVDLSAAPIAQACPGISSSTVWPLAIIDPSFVNCITLNSQKPARAEQNVPTTTEVVISFCDERLAPGVGVVTIGDQSIERVLNVNYFEYPVVDSMINGNTLTIPVTGLKENTTYSIIIPQGAITDEAGNSFIGITDANLWIFTTGDFTDPIVSVPAITVLNDGTADPIAITSSEAGVVFLAEEGVAANQTALIAAIALDKAVTAVLTTAGSVNVDVEGLVPGKYIAYGFDASGRMGKSVNVVTVEKIPVLPYSTIKEIQGQVATSPLVGTRVRTKGVVTAVLSNGFYIQDANAAWGGVFVSSTTTDVSEGTSVEIVGTVSEVDGLTTVGTIESMTFISKVITVNPLTVGPSTSLEEMYEGVLVKVTGRVATTGTASSTADWAIASVAGTNYTISNAIFGTFAYKQDFKYEVTGIGVPAAAAYKVLATDIYDWSSANGVDNLANTIKVYPNPFDKFITLSVSNDVVVTKAVITNIAGQLVKEVINPNNTIPTSELRSGVYFISLHTVDGIAKTERIIKR